MVRRLIIAAAVAIASLGANAEYFYWHYLDGGKQTQPHTVSDKSFYVFVTGETPTGSTGGINNPDSAAGAIKSAVKATTYTVQTKDAALSKISRMIGGDTNVDLGNLSIDAYSRTAIGAASFTAFAVLLNAADITKATEYILFEDYYLQNTRTRTETFNKAGTPLESAGDTSRMLVTWGAVKTGEGSSSGSSQWDTSSSSSSWLDVTTIPEPTSGVMLLLGVAALALKRKK